MKKIGICTIYTGYNYGSSLQAYSVKIICEKIAFEPVIFHLNGSLVKGRNVRPKKLFITFIKYFFHPFRYKNIIKQHKNQLHKIINSETKVKFDIFNKDYIEPLILRYNKLKKIAYSAEYKAFICGSDQIWKGDAIYIDPFYYLRFSPSKKRIAFAPSFGISSLPSYNLKVIKKYISDFNYLSVREEAGKEIINKIFDIECKVLIDPTLCINKEEWIKYLNLKKNDNKYILTYFLDVPSDETIELLKTYSLTHNCKIIGILNEFSKQYCDEFVSAGPAEFLELIYNASCIFTDSFHGTAFSINFNKNFYVFERNYVAGMKQSSRIISLLKLVNLEYRLINKNELIEKEIDYAQINEIINKESKKAFEYLNASLEGIDE